MYIIKLSFYIFYMWIKLISYINIYLHIFNYIRNNKEYKKNIILIVLYENNIKISLYTYYNML